MFLKFEYYILFILLYIIIYITLNIIYYFEYKLIHKYVSINIFRTHIQNTFFFDFLCFVRGS